ncbi:MAG: hypothetical protein RR630_09895 [Coprobacillus sp.]
MDGLERLFKGVDYYKNSFEFDECLLEKMHQLEDIIDIELSYQKDIKQIMMQYMFQKEIKNKCIVESQDFTLTEEELKIIDTFIKCYR